MPWTTKDAPRFNGAATGRLAEVWARVANDTLTRCLREGGKQDECEARAVREANAAVALARKMRRG